MRGLCLAAYLLIVASCIGVASSVWSKTDAWILVKVVVSVVLLAVVVTVAWGILRAIRAKLVVGEDEVVIINVLRTVVIARSDLRRFVAGRSGKWLFAETFSGEFTPVDAISDGWTWSARRRAARWNREFGLDAT